ncbi:hypothetical protein PHLGIDRAFT_65374 [Phlebiopsis gigantea 11061_1 CR5-6]|uniref:Copper acquisition factor BIM1-like domain-containing protein n=1 Tax=Phlebiopsis gigantea (strain 11061_1 CR5-6) TaxID=745531 RepID=A0A0C3SEJ7_PHLG1|nr:hypothetical protein PHLGIDRAFT_65374 [Phlebiopsis gigantea 11061_1 CR5-6]
MRFATLPILAALLGSASAHFQLQYPPPRGVFAEDTEPTFCDGYTSAVSNRTEFPLSGGFVSLNSEHPVWALGVQLSTLANPQSFQNFSAAVPFFQVTGEGLFCFPVDLAAAGLAGVQDGANVTLQFTFDGGDGELFQCADLTLRSGASVAGSVACTNATGASVQTISQPSATPSASGSIALSSGAAASASASASTASASSAAAASRVVGLTGLLGVAGAVLAVL